MIRKSTAEWMDSFGRMSTTPEHAREAFGAITPMVVAGWVMNVMGERAALRALLQGALYLAIITDFEGEETLRGMLKTACEMDAGPKLRLVKGEP